VIITRVAPNHVSGQPGKKLVYIYPWDENGIEITDILSHEVTLGPRALFSSFKAISIMCLNSLDAPCILSVRGVQHLATFTTWRWYIAHIVTIPSGMGEGSNHLIIDKIHQPLDRLFIQLRAPIAPTGGVFRISVLGEQ